MPAIERYFVTMTRSVIIDACSASDATLAAMDEFSKPFPIPGAVADNRTVVIREAKTESILTERYKI